MSDYKVINDNGYERSWEELYEDNVMFSKYTDKLEKQITKALELNAKIDDFLKHRHGDVYSETYDLIFEQEKILKGEKDEVN